MKPLAQKIEALLLAYGEPMKKDELAKKLNAPIEQVDESINEVQQCLAGHGISLLVTSSSLQLVTSPHLSDFMSSFMSDASSELSQAASETLSIIAYKGPISRYDVDVIRGVDSRRMIELLLHRGIIEDVTKNTRARMYDVTEKFLTHIGIENKNRLPDWENLSNDDRVRKIIEESHPAV